MCFGENGFLGVMGLRGEFCGESSRFLGDPARFAGDVMLMAGIVAVRFLGDTDLFGDF